MPAAIVILEPKNPKYTMYAVFYKIGTPLHFFLQLSKREWILMKV